PSVPHVRATTRLRNLLHAQTPTTLCVVENAGIAMADDGRTYRIPDITVLHATSIELDEGLLVAADVVLAVEVLSPDSGGDDQVMKRHRYGKIGIPHYWIVDQKTRTLTVLRHDGREAYDEVAVVRPGESFKTDEPFPLELDPADF